MTTMLGMAILTLATASVLLMTAHAPDWLMALVLSGRGFAIGLVIHPPLNRLIGTLPKEEVPDANTLFSIVDRISGATGIALIVTFFQVREKARAAAALSAGAAHAMAQTANAGFHDTIALIACLSAAGLIMAQGLRSPTGRDRSISLDVTTKTTI
ncbi:MAG: hypothetical protein M0Z66_09555 [Thermaerobacter sp.]|nr:hypothetical protein [Thermaerobacter sp.]